MTEHDPLRPLHDKRRELTDRWLAFKTASRREGVQLGFWTGVGALAIAADLTLLGGLGTALIDPGKPWQNGSNESFNGKLRDDDCDRTSSIRKTESWQSCRICCQPPS